MKWKLELYRGYLYLRSSQLLFICYEQGVAPITLTPMGMKQNLSVVSSPDGVDTVMAGGRLP